MLVQFLDHVLTGIGMATALLSGLLAVAVCAVLAYRLLSGE